MEAGEWITILGSPGFVKYQPDAAYTALFHQSLTESADRLALAVGLVCGLVLDRQPAPESSESRGWFGLAKRFVRPSSDEPETPMDDRQ